jgi:hypothetical protein
MKVSWPWRLYRSSGDGFLCAVAGHARQQSASAAASFFIADRPSLPDMRFKAATARGLAW